MSGSKFGSGLVLTAVLALAATAGLAQGVVPSPVVPGLVPYSGELAEQAGQRVAVNFAVYAAPNGGSALWAESQNVSVGKDGKFAVLLGAASSAGLPQSVFAAGEARWLGIRLGDGEETRTPLASVPYAMKAADAESLAGRAASEFVTQDQLNAQLATQLSASLATAAANTIVRPDTTTPAGVTGSGTAKYLPVWTAASTLGNSVIYQSGTSTSPLIGFNTTSPNTLVDVNGEMTVRNELMLTAAAATSSAAVNSPAMEWVSSAWNSSTAASVAQKFAWRITASGNNTTAPTGSLQLLTATGTSTPAATGLSISPKGIITFASGQTFPGAGSGSGTTIAAGSGLTSSVSGTTETLSVNPEAIPILAGNSGNDNAALGASALASNTGSQNTAVGDEALYANTTGSYNSASGDNALAANMTGSLNTANGFSALAHNSYGSNNTAIGSYAGPDVSSEGLTNSTAIGYNATVSQSNALVLGQTTAGSPGASHVNVGVGTATPTTTMELSVNAPNVLGPTLLLSNPGGTTSSATNGQAAAASIDFKTYLHTSTQTSPTSRIEALDDNYGNELVFQTKTPGADSNPLSTVMELIGGRGGSAYIGNPLIVDFYNGVPVNGPQVAEFGGNVSVDGTVSSDEAEVKIDHPSDPANMYLQHATVQSSEMMNIYSGNVTTDKLGLATVQLPDWFEVENADFRYQLTTIGRDAHAWIAQKVSGHSFKIATNATFVEVSWQITAVRQDAYAKAHPLVVEKAKPAAERGFYIHPELYGQPAEKSLLMKQHPKETTRSSASAAANPATRNAAIAR